MKSLLLTLALILLSGSTMAHPASRSVQFATDVDIVPQRSVGNKLFGAMLVALGSKMTGGNSSSDSWRREQEATIKQLLQDMQELRSAITEKTSNISFHVQSSTSYGSTYTVNANEVIKFGSVIHNNAPAGFGYNKTANKFRCPVDGIYAFQFSTMTFTRSTWYQFAIMKGSSKLSTIRAYPYTFNYMSVSTSAVTPCNRGEYVYVKEVAGYTPNIYGGTDTTFTGYILN